MVLGCQSNCSKDQRQNSYTKVKRKSRCCYEVAPRLSETEQCPNRCAARLPGDSRNMQITATHSLAIPSRSEDKPASAAVWGCGAWPIPLGRPVGPERRRTRLFTQFQTREPGYAVVGENKPKQTGRSVSVTQWCPTLCDPPDCSQPGSPVHRILQTRILELAAIYPSKMMANKTKQNSKRFTWFLLFSCTSRNPSERNLLF